MVRGTTSGAGSTTTAVDSGHAGWGDDYYKDRYILLTSGTYSGHYRPVSGYTSSSGTFTWLRALAGGSGSSVTYEVYPFDPTWYTQALREAALKVQLRPLRWTWAPKLPLDQGHARYVHSLPDVFRSVRTLRRDATSTEVVDDDFTRADASTPGGVWANGVGTWGISGNKLYCVSDTDLDVVVQSSDPQLYDGYMSALVEGTYGAAGADFRVPSLVFRYLDSNDFLTCGLVNLSGTDSLVLSRMVAGSSTTIASAAVALTDARQYQVAVRWVGSHVEAWVDGAQYLDVTLSETERKYYAGGNVGVYLAKNGTPGSNITFVDDFRAHRISDTVSVMGEWHFDKPDLMLDRWYSDAVLLHAAGSGPFSTVAIDTTDGQLTSDTTAVIECAADSEDPVWELLMSYATAFLYRLASVPGNMPSEQDAMRYKDLARTAWEFAESQMTQYKPSRAPLELRGVRW